MNLTAEKLAEAAARLPRVTVRFRRPPLWRLGAWPRVSALERAFGRFVQYPAELAFANRAQHHWHVADHSYAHLVRGLPASKTGVYCHDLDAFRALFSGAHASPTRRAMARWTLGGLQRAALVFHSTRAVRRELVSRAWVEDRRLVHAPYGVAEEFTARPTSWDERIARDYPPRYVLHVGSSIPRKNPEGLLHIFARLSRHEPELRLVQIGGSFSDAQLELARALGVREQLVQQRGLPRAALAALYRRAALVVLPSVAEGFGLPVIEAQACGAIPLVSDLEVLREVGGAAARYVPREALDAWEHIGEGMLTHRGPHPSALANASKYTWKRHAELVIDAYRSLVA